MNRHSLIVSHSMMGCINVLAKACKLKNEVFLRNAANILEIDFDRLSNSLRYKTRTVAGSVIELPVKRDECLVFRDSLAKELYNKLFSWLVKRLNFSVMPPGFNQPGANVNTLLLKYYHIGLLDIFWIRNVQI